MLKVLAYTGEEIVELDLEDLKDYRDYVLVWIDCYAPSESFKSSSSEGA